MSSATSDVESMAFGHRQGSTASAGTASADAGSAQAEPAAANPGAADPEGLLRVLVAHGRCDARAVERARRVASEGGGRVDAVLCQLGLVSERDLAEAFAALLGLPVAAPARYPAEPVLADRLAARFLRNARALPLGLEAGTLAVALADPLDRFVPAAIAAATGRPVALEVAVPLELEAALDRLYPDAPAGGPGGARDASTEAALDAGPLEDDAERLKDLASEAPVIRLVNGIIARAVETRASDIHIEPFEDRLRVRYRQDGVLQEAETPPPRLAAAIVSRIKIMARLDIAQRQMPQDGRIKLAVRGQEVDFRVATIPSLHGETVVLRVLDRSAVALDYAALGLSEPVVARVRAARGGAHRHVIGSGPARGSAPRWSCPTASCWSAARPGPARPPPYTPACSASTPWSARSSPSRTRSSTSSPASCRAK